MGKSFHIGTDASTKYVWEQGNVKEIEEDEFTVFLELFKK